MDFRFDNDERGVIAGFRDAIRHALPVARLRRPSAGPDGWSLLATGGWLTASLPEEMGGAALSNCLIAGIAREAGALLAVDSFTNNGFLIPQLIRRIADTEKRAEFLNHHIAYPGFLLADGRSRNITRSDSLHLETAWCFGVQNGFDAYELYETGRGHLELRRYPSEAVRFQPLAGLALDLGSVQIEPRNHPHAVALRSTASDISDVVDLTQLLHSAALIGVADEAMRITIEYAKVRQQFGQSIGKFQAVKHILADVCAQSEIAGNAVFYAALRAGQDKTAIPSARLLAVTAALDAAQAMVQIHGGFGFTWDSDVHYYMKTALNGSLRFGTDDSIAVGEEVRDHESRRDTL